MMRSKVFIISFTILLVLGQIVFGQEKGVGNRTVSKLPAKEKRWALLIGVSQYEDGNITPLPGANNDARGLRDALRDYAGFDEKQIILLTTDESKDRQPTKNNILRYLGNLSGTVPKDGLLLVAFSGHGIERQKQAFLLASDTPYNDNVRVLERTALSVSNDFKELIRDTGVGQVIILLDACRNDPSSGRSSSDNLLTEAYKDGFSFDVRNKEVEAFATLYATSIGERAYEYTRENKGYFTWAFIEGLKGGAANEAGEITLGNLIRYVEKYVPQQVKIDLGGNKLQRPFSIVEGFRAEELVLGIAKNSNLPTATRNESLVDNNEPTADKELNKATIPFIKTAVFRELAKNLLKYDRIAHFSDGLAKVSIKGREGFIDQNGKEVIPVNYDVEWEGFSEGLAVVWIGGKYGFIDKTGSVVIAAKYNYASPFSEGLGRIRIGRKEGFIDKTGREVIKPKYDTAFPFSEGLAVVKIKDKRGFIDKLGREIIKPKYDGAFGFSEGLAPVQIGDKWGFIDKTERQVIAPKYDFAQSFSEGLALVWVKDGQTIKHGFIDKTGREVIPPKYTDASSFSDGFAWVRVSEYTYGLIDKTGREVIPVDKYTIWCDAFLKEGFVGVELNGRKGFVDFYGNEYFDF